MTSTIEALQALYVAMGGELTDTYDDIANGEAVSNYVTIPDMINAISEVKADEQPEIPAVTASDNGSVLKVVDGEWAIGEDAT